MCFLAFGDATSKHRQFMTSGNGVSNRSGASSRYFRIEYSSDVASTRRRAAADATVAIPP
jgi:hypothetical protein